MKEIRLCDDGKLELTSELCKSNNLGIEIQGFYNPYIENKDELLEKYKEILPEIKGGRSYHAPFWDLNLGTKIKELQENLNNRYTNLLRIVEGFPELKASESFFNLQNSLKKVEEQLHAARRIYNIEVTKYNITIKKFLALIIANIFKFQEKPLFDMPDNEKENIKIDI